MKSFTVLLLALGLIVVTSASALGQSVANYAPVTRTTGVTYTSIAGTGTSMTGWRNGTSLDDNRSTAQPIGFTFYYDGVAYTSFSASTNGYLDFSSSTANGSGTGNYSYSNTYFSTANGTLLAIAPLYDDLTVPTAGTLAGNMKYQVDGISPNRVLTVEWIGMETYGNSGPDLNWQIKLHETSGVIDLVYGTMTAGTSTYSYTCGLNGATMSASPLASELLSQQTANTATFSNVAANTLSAIPAANSMLTFTPAQNVTPLGPKSITFVSVTQSGMTVGWTDSSTTETFFAVSRSTDGTNFSPVGSVASTTFAGMGSTYSLPQSGLIAGQTYYFRITANNEASAASPYLAGSQATNPPGSITSNASGNWGDGATWVGGVVPGAYDNVTIADGHTVTINVAAVCYNLNVGQGVSGVLQWDSATARTLTAGQSVTIAANGAFQTQNAGTVTAHVLSIGGSLTNNGTLDFSTNGNTAKAGITFTGANDAGFGGTGGTTDIATLTVNKGTSYTPVLELNPASFTVQGVNSDVAGFLTLTNGTLKISGSFTMTNRVFTAAAYSIGTTGGLWLNNASFTVAGQNGTPVCTGRFRLSNGTYNVGTAAGNSFTLSTGANVTIEGGAFNATGRLNVTSSSQVITYAQTGGTVTLCKIGNSSNSTASFDMGAGAASSVTLTGGSIVLQLASTAATTKWDYNNCAGNQAYGACTLQLGNAATTASVQAFQLRGFMPNLVITNTTANHTATTIASAFSGSQSYVENVTINAGTALIPTYMLIVMGPTFTNNGILTATATNSSIYFLGPASGKRSAASGKLPGEVDAETGLASAIGLEPGFAFRGNNGRMVQTYTGTGTVTAPMTAISFDNNLSGVTIDPAVNQIVTNRVNLFGGLVSNCNKLTLGNGGTTTGVTQMGTGTAPATQPGGSYDQAPLFNYGSGGYNVLYAYETTGRTTGFEIPAARTVSLMLMSNSAGVTVAGGDLTVAATLTLTAGKVNTSAGNRLKLANAVTPPAGSAASFVNGPLAVEYNVAVATNKSFAIGKDAAFRPMILKSVNTGGVSQYFTGEVINSNCGGTPNPPMVALDPARYWSIGNSANLNAAARVNLAYGVDDGVLSASSARVTQSPTVAGTYMSLGGTGTTTTVESTADLTPGNDYFTLGVDNPPITWDGGALTSNWGDASNWSPDGVPTGADNVSLTAGSATTINVNGNYVINNLDLGSNMALNITSNTLTVNGVLNQAGSTIDLGTGTLELKGGFSKSAGTFTANAGTAAYSGAAAQAVLAGVTYYNLALRNGGSGVAKTLTAAGSYLVNNDLTVESTAQLALSAATSTTVSVAGNLNYAGIGAGANIGSLQITLTGSGKTINGASLWGKPTALARSLPKPADIRTVTVPMTTDPNQLKVSVSAAGEKIVTGYQNTYAQKAAVVEKLLATADPNARLVIVLDDQTVIRNPESFAGILVAPSLDFALNVATTGSYTLGDNITLAAGRILTDSGRLNCGPFAIGGGGGISLPSGGILGTGSLDPLGLGATVLTTGTNTYSDGSIIEYNATGDQTVHAAVHPPTAMLYTGGSGTKSLDGNLAISGTSSSLITKAALWVAAGSTFGDGGYRLSFTSSGYDNVNVLGGYSSTGSGSISYESGPYLSIFQAVDGTTFGDVLTNFGSSTNSLYIAAPGTSTVTIYFRNLVFGGSAGTGNAGGLWKLSYTGTTHLVINGNLTMSPVTTSATGGGFTGNAGSNIGSVTLKGNLTSASTASTQPIFDSTGTANSFVFGGSGAQTLLMPQSTTLFSGTPVSLMMNNAAGLILGGASARTYTIGGKLDLTSGTITTGIHTLAIGSAGSVVRTSGHVIGKLQKNVATGSAVVRNFEIGTGGDYAPVAVTFASVSVAGNLTATTAAGDHAQIATSGLDAAKTANRTWTLANSGTAFTTYDATLSFVAGDLDIGADPNSLYVKRYDTGSWSAPVTGGRTSTSTQATGLTGFGDFQAGEKLSYTITASAGAHGSINPNGAVVVGVGEDQAFAMAPDAGYHVADVLVDGSSVGAVLGYTFSNVTATHTIEANFAVNSYTISASAGAGGSITPSGAVPVTHGGTQVFAIAADPCYHIADVLVDGVSQGAISGYTFTNVTADATIAASFAIDTYVIAASAGPGGSINPNGGVVVNCGSDQSFTITPDACSRVDDVLVDGGSVGAVAGYTFSNVAASHTISASFVPRNTVNAGPASGLITLVHPVVTVPVTIDRGCATEAVMAFSVKFTVGSPLNAPDSIMVGGFLNADAPPARTVSFQAIDLGGGEYEADGTTLGAPCGSSALTGTLFSIKLSSLASGGSGAIAITEVRLRDCDNNPIPGTIGTPATVQVDRSAPALAVTAPNGGETWYVGSSENITWTGSDPEGVASFELAYSLDGGATYPQVIATGLPGTQTSYAWSVPNAQSSTARIKVTGYDIHGNVASDDSDADFMISPYVITAGAGAHGQISPSGAVPVPYGAEQAFAISADPCYHISEVVVDGGLVGPVAGYTFSNVTADHSITASFAMDVHTITATAGPGGSITPSGAVPVDCGSDQGFAIAADSGYNLMDVLVDGISQGPITAYTFTNVTADHTIEASFTGQWTITASAGAGGSIAPSGVIGVANGGDQSFAVTPAPCYHIMDVLVDDVSQGPIASYTFANVSANHTIEAVFHIDAFELSYSVEGNGTLLVVPDLRSFDCGSSVQITANAGPGWGFDHWEGDATGSDNPLTLVMNGNKTIVAVFVDIAPPEITVTSPNGGEVWTSGTVQPITWTASDNVAVTAIDLAYSTDGGLTYPNVIATGLANSGTYNWTVPNSETATARVRATAYDAAAHATSDGSEANFSIQDPTSAVAASLLVTKEFAGVYPNPASTGEVHVLYRIARPASVEINIYSVNGHLVKKLSVGNFGGGVGTTTWNGLDEAGRPVPAGIYLVQIHAGPGLDANKRLVLIR